MDGRADGEAGRKAGRKKKGATDRRKGGETLCRNSRTKGYRSWRLLKATGEDPLRSKAQQMMLKTRRAKPIRNRKEARRGNRKGRGVQGTWR